jgi:SAM-dependent methyltransferase
MFEVVVLSLMIVLTLAVLLVVVVHLVAAGRNAVPPVFTPPGVLAQVVEALDLPERGRLVDLGCGDGRVLWAVLKRRPRLRVTGVENNPVVFALAWRRLRDKAALEMREIEDVPLEGVDRVFAYLGPGLMAALEPRFERELQKGARVVSQQFPLPGRRPDRVVELKGGKPYANKLYVYDYR